MFWMAFFFFVLFKFWVASKEEALERKGERRILLELALAYGKGRRVHVVLNDAAKEEWSLRRVLEFD